MYAALRAVIQNHRMFQSLLKDISKVYIESIGSEVWNQGLSEYKPRAGFVKSRLRQFGLSCRAIQNTSYMDALTSPISLPSLFRTITDLTIPFGPTDTHGISVYNTSDNLVTVKDSQLPAFRGQSGSVETIKVTLMLAVSFSLN